MAISHGFTKTSQWLPKDRSLHLLRFSPGARTGLHVNPFPSAPVGGHQTVAADWHRVLWRPNPPSTTCLVRPSSPNRFDSLGGVRCATPATPATPHRSARSWAVLCIARFLFGTIVISLRSFRFDAWRNHDPPAIIDLTSRHSLPVFVLSSDPFQLF